ncbi:unnamed protein product [Cuscuta epithymum]|uniref:Retrotransposon Copia-like N-terminal domain-containing protein n=1 Tax=Cuscuta epithymum TaxID=186058 RepID=A0AAV0DSH3_9ASTE|nr:unnamed protein product [Cuscuta epithymum]
MATHTEEHTQGNPPARIDPTSPYFLGPQDRPGDIITPVKLIASNYEDWSNAVRLALRARRKYVFVDGSIVKPAPPCTEEDWLTLHSMIVSWLLNTVSPEVRGTLSCYEDAAKLWNDLKERFSSVDGPRIHQVKTDLARCVQTKGMPVGTYYAKLQTLWDALNNYEPLIACKCNRCTCDVLGQHEKRRASERMHQFLMGLYSDFFGVTRSQLLLQTPLPTLNRAYQQVTQEERVRGMVQTQDERPEVLGFALRTDGKSVGRGTKVDKSGLICSYCKYSGHEVANCFELNGYPDWWGDRPRPGIKGTGRGRPVNTGSSSRNKPGAKAHAAVATDHTNKESNGGGSSSSVPLPGFTQEQWKSLLSMLGPSLEEADWNG